MEDLNRCKHQQIFQLLMVIFSLFFSSLAGAHALKQSYIFLTIDDDAITGRVEMTIADVNQALTLQLPTDGSVSKKELAAHIPTLKAYYADRVKIDLAGLVLGEFAIVDLPLAQYVSMAFAFENLTPLPDAINYEYNILFDIDPDHRGFVVIENDWRSGTFNEEGNIALVFSPDETRRSLDLTTSTVMNGYFEMVKLGIHHIWEGIDHVLFLLALLLPSVMYRPQKDWLAKQKFREAFMYVVKIVTVFTLAHTITLSAATLSLVSLPSRFVESIIAISIAITALDILYPIFRSRIWMIVFTFGLFHGFGFASVLAEYAIPTSYMTFSLLAFNLGVEIGQVAIVAVVFPMLYLLRNFWMYQQVVLRGGAAAMIIVSLYWFIERGFMIDLPAGAALNWVRAAVGI